MYDEAIRIQRLHDLFCDLCIERWFKMLITIISIIIFVVGICFLIMGLKIFFDCLVFVGVVMSFIGMLGTLISVILICLVQPTKQTDYEQMLYKKEVLEYRVEHQEDNIVGNELLYQEIVEFNNQLRTNKRFANNIWINWFVNDLVATIEYVDYKKGGN